MRTRQLEMKIPSHGGRRKGAGRKKRLPHEPSHAKRPWVNSRLPLNITMKLLKGLPNLRTSRNLRAFKRATISAGDLGLRVTHFSLLSNHIHLIAEADDNEALERGMKSLSVMLAAAVNRLRLRSGPVFAGRFHLHVLKNPTEVRRAIEYVVHNFAKHLGVAKFVDAFSSAKVEMLAPRSWLLKKGWRSAPS